MTKKAKVSKVFIPDDLSVRSIENGYLVEYWSPKTGERVTKFAGTIEVTLELIDSLLGK